MRKIIQYSVMFCLVCMQSLVAQQTPILGEWDLDGYDITIDVHCNCTAEQKAEIIDNITSNTITDLDSVFLLSYLEFTEDNTVEGMMGENEFKGNYNQMEDKLIVEIDGTIHEFQIIFEEDVRLLAYPFEDELLKHAKGSHVLDDIGQMDYKITAISMLFSNMFDQPFEDHVDGEWE